MSLTIEDWPIDRPIPYARNPRKISDEAVAAVAGSLKEFGWKQPIIVDADGVIVAGHTRLRAARLLGMATVPVVVASDLTPAQVQAYRLADNRVAEFSQWDPDLLKIELDECPVDLDFAGFDDLLAEVEEKKEEAGMEKGDADAVPAEAQGEPVSQRGEVFALGPHRLMCGDSTSAEDWHALMGPEQAELMHADPPYGMGKEKDGVENDNLYDDKLDTFQMQWWKAVRRYLKDNASAYIWGNAPDLWRLWYRGGLADSDRLTLRNEITWDKREENPTMLVSGVPLASQRMYHPTERCLFFMLGEQGFNNNADNYWEGWEPIRSYLESEMKKCGWTVKDINRITGTQMGGHWVTKSQWALITAEHYEKIKKAARDHGAFKKEHDELKEEHDELKQAFYATRAHFDNTHDNMTDVWDFKRVTGEERHGHATPKPVDMMARIMKSSCPEGGIVVEPFGGSGSTLIGAAKTGRVCRTMEISPVYCDVIRRRWTKFARENGVDPGTGALE